MKSSSTVKRVWALLGGAGVTFYPLLSCALGLGDLQVESQLNQPLRARIEIVGVGDFENGPPIRAQFAPDLVPSDGTNSGLLQSLQLRVEMDSSHRHFVVVSSREPLTEPLFDLPVQVAAESVQVVRNYSVLLDPPLLEDGRRSAPVLAAAPVAATAVAEKTVYTVTRSDRLRRITRRRGARTAQGGTVAARSSSAGGAHTEANVRAPAKSAMQEQLQGQLVTLQHMLTIMQATISAQDAQIAELSRRVAAGPAQTAALSPLPPTRVEPPQAVAPREVIAAEEAPPPFWLRPVTYYGIAAVGTLAAILALLTIRLRKARRVAANAQSGSAAIGPGLGDSKNAVESRSESLETSRSTIPAAASPATTTAFGSSRRTSGTHGYEVLDRLATTQETAIVNELAMAIGSALTQSPETIENSGTSVSTAPQFLDRAPASATATLATTAVIPTEELQALELAAALGLESTARIDAGIDAATDATVAVTRQDMLRIPEHDDETDLLLSPASAAAQKLEMQPDRSVTNREIIKLLERSLEAEPHRIDIQLKLLEMYHQEALGNRDSFHSLVSKVAAEHRGLTPAQQLHLDMLQRTLDDSKTDHRKTDHSRTDSRSDLPAEAAL